MNLHSSRFDAETSSSDEGFGYLVSERRRSYSRQHSQRSLFHPSGDAWETERTFYEFFAGGGMARMGLGPTWHCLFANDFDPKKAASYERNWGRNGEMVVCGIQDLRPSELPGRADLAWASFPCQDLSLAGGQAGLAGERSGTFWHFAQLLTGLSREGRAPSLVVLENVYGALSSHGGRDFAAIGDFLAGEGYKFGAAVIDAARFLPQSRPRLFFVAIRADVSIPCEATRENPSPEWHPAALVKAYQGLSERAMAAWQWFELPQPELGRLCLAEIVEAEPKGVTWHTPAETQRLLGLMTEGNLSKVRAAQESGEAVVGTIYKRTRPDGDGTKRQRAEIRLDGIAGCLRTPSGGSSRQTLIFIDGPSIRSRLLSPREAARLMGLPDTYELPERYNDAYHLVGDGLAVPVVSFLEKNLLRPILESQRAIGSSQAA